ncbi:MAG: PEP-CTERM sorting domain-containing protein [Acidobacteria bacterium]|nr:PEP-CTERM sorting domain-containing protein [Acidobacteriota bacterium]MCI0666170.1 PEP-CTERM sorting domain-containing protein [Acidobacteriota bacterium]
MQIRSILIIRQAVVCVAVCCIAVQGLLAETITYQQLRQDQGGRTLTSAPIPASARTNQTLPNYRERQGQDPSLQDQAPREVEISPPPEFVRLHDGRIVRFGPEMICDENCVDPVTPAAFRGNGKTMWWIVSPLVAGVILCAILCRGDGDNPQPLPTIIIPVHNPVTVQTTPSVVPPSTEVPEPTTLVLLGIGLGALAARRRRKAR